MVLVGDLYQLPPVITNDEIKIVSSLYPNGHFFLIQMYQKYNYI